MWAPLVRSSPVRNCLPRELTECHHTQPRSPRWSHGRGGSLDQDPTCQPGTAVVFGRNDHCHCRALQLAERLQPPSLPTRGAYNPLGAPSAQGVAQPGWPTPERECIEREREREQSSSRGEIRHHRHVLRPRALAVTGCGRPPSRMSTRGVPMCWAPRICPTPHR